MRTDIQQEEQNTKAIHKQLTIPYCLLEHTVTSKKFRSLQVLVTTKLLFGSSFLESQIMSISKILDVHKKTVNTHLQTLVNDNLLGFDPLESRYFCRRWNYLRILQGKDSTVGYRIRLDQIKKFKAFAIAATFDQLIAGQQSRRWKVMRERLKKGTSKQIAFGTNGYYPVANAAYAKIFKVSEATASRYRSLAAEAGWLELKPCYKKVMVNVNPRVDRLDVKEYLDTGLVYQNGKYYLQEPTQVRSKMRRKRLPSLMQKKLQSLEKGIVKGNGNRKGK